MESHTNTTPGTVQGTQCYAVPSTKHMPPRMTGANDSDGADKTVRTSIEVDEEVWRQLRAKAVEDGAQVSEMLETVLREYFDMTEPDTN